MMMMREHSHNQSTSTSSPLSVVPPAVDHQKRLIQQISIVLSTVLFVIFAAYPIYIAFADVSKTITIVKPSLNTYTALYSEQTTGLTCTCSQPSIFYSNFIQISYTIHQICNSDFVTSTWISYLAMSPGMKFPYDFRSTGSASFQELAALCQLAPMAINHAIAEFHSNPYVSVYVTPSNQFQRQAQARVDQLILTTINAFLFPLSMIRSEIQNNVLLSGLQTNAMQMIQNGTIQPSFQIYQNCNCAISPECIMPSAIYNYSSVFYVPGFFTGCYITASLFQSDLRCFFNQTCLTQLRNLINPSSSMSLTPLNSTLDSRFLANSSISQLVASLMIEQWNTTISYSAYYDVCSPMECSYTVMARNDRTYIATMLIGLIGGLIAILNFIVPRVVKFFVYIVQTSEPAVVRTITMISRQ